MAEIVVKSEIAGKVWAIETPVGTAVGEDETMLVLESMKMEIPVFAPEAGVVKKLLVGEGDSVAEGQNLAILERS